MKLVVPGLLIEYLITGAVALLWFVPSAERWLSFDLLKLKGEWLLYLVPGVYVLGMLVDMTAFAITNVPKRWIRKRTWSKYGTDANFPSGTRRKVFLHLYSAELAAEAERRGSRDRIARGTCINALLAGLLIPSVPWSIALLIFFMAAGMWVFFEFTSHGFGLLAEQELKAKLAREEAAGKADT